jgi:HAD superfamily hydrolase (TIGR01509 family)
MLRDTLLFDLDGTIADTDHLHFEAFRRLLAGHGRAIDHATYKLRIMGQPNPAIAAWLFPDADEEAHRAFSDAKEALFRSLARDMTPLPGLVEMLDWADRIGLRRAVVTNAPRVNAEFVLDALGLTTRFETLVIGEELARSKPDPLPYATALDRLGRPPGKAVAFEDSRSGIAAATAAGLFTYGVATGLDPATLRASGAQEAIADFTDPVLQRSLAAQFGSAPD